MQRELLRFVLILPAMRRRRDKFVFNPTGKQASEALAFLLCHPSGADGGNSYNATHSGRLQTGMAYLGGGGGAAATAAAKEGEVHWKRLMFFFDM